MTVAVFIKEFREDIKNAIGRGGWTMLYCDSVEYDNKILILNLVSSFVEYQHYTIQIGHDLPGLSGFRYVIIMDGQLYDFTNEADFNPTVNNFMTEWELLTI